MAEAVLPAASSALNVRVMIRGQVPLCVSVKVVGFTPGQLSVAVTVGGGGTSAKHWTVVLAGAMIVGGCVSLTVTVNVHTESGLLGLASFAVTVTVVTPTGKNEPLAGVAITVAPGQLSDTVGIE